MTLLLVYLILMLKRTVALKLTVIVNRVNGLWNLNFIVRRLGRLSPMNGKGLYSVLGNGLQSGHANFLSHVKIGVAASSVIVTAQQWALVTHILIILVLGLRVLIHNGYLSWSILITCCILLFVSKRLPVLQMGSNNVL